MTKLTQMVCDYCGKKTLLDDTRGWESYNWFIEIDGTVNLETHDYWEEDGRFSLCSHCRGNLLDSKNTDSKCSECGSSNIQLDLKNDKDGFRDFRFCSDCSPFVNSS